MELENNDVTLILFLLSQNYKMTSCLFDMQEIFLMNVQEQSQPID